jgi:hypothetical protein
VWYRRFAAMSFYMLPAGGKTFTTGLRPWKCTLLVLRTTFPPKGELYSPLSIGTHKHPNGKRR